MHYKFPVIEHIDQLRPAIQGRSEFVVSNRELFDVVNYHVAMADSFGDAQDPLAQLRRECRGIKFCPVTGRILARPYQKFFNVQEKPETQTDQLALDQDHWILEKLDGSMIHAVPTPQGFRLCTKMGITDVAAQAEVFVAARGNYQNMIQESFGLGVTAIFEWCSPQQRIVVNYSADRLVLTGVRELVTGQYWSYQRMADWAESHNVPVVARWTNTASQWTQLIDHTRQLQDAEGYVVRWHNGHMVKIKADHYVLMHRTKDQIRWEKDVVNLLVTESVDDVRPLLTEADAERLSQFEACFWSGLRNTADQIAQMYQQAQHYTSQRDYAVEFVLQQPRWAQPLLFELRARPTQSVVELLMAHIARSTSSQTRVDAVRVLWGNHSWNTAQPE
jgi:RNA ligase